MSQAARDTAFDLGRRLRDRRCRAGVTQAAAAAMAGTSASTVSRIELGRGERVPLGVWIDLAHAVGVDLLASPRDHEVVYWGAFARLATHGEWVVGGRRGDTVWFDRPAHPIRFITTVVRPAERVVVRIVTVLTDLTVEVRRLADDVRAIRVETPDGRPVAGVLVVVRSARNVRLAGAAARVSTGRWISATRDPRARMPSWLGVVWMAPQGTHLLPVA